MGNKLSFGIVLCATLLISGFTYGEESKSFREALVAEGNVIRVYAVDDYHSFIVGETSARTGEATTAFDDKMQELCIKYKGTPEVKKLITKETPSNFDPITQKGVQRETKGEWLTLDKIKPPAYAFAAKTTWLTRDYPPRCNGVFEVVERYGQRFKSGSFAYQSFLLKHSTPQPFVYKSPALTPYDAIVMPPDGEFEPPLVSEGFIGILKNLAKAPRYYGEDMYQYTSTLCRKNGGDMLFVIPKHHFFSFTNEEEALKKVSELGLQKEVINADKGRWIFRIVKLTETNDALEAFIYRSANVEKNSSMLFACKGEKKFVIRENFKDDNYKAFFASNRDLEGVDYITKEAANKIGLQDKTSVLAAPTSVEPTKVESTKQVGFEEQMAQDVSAQKTPTIKIHAGSEYTGRYNGVSGDGCDLVSVIKVWDPTLKEKGRVDVNNYKVCQGKVASLGETGVESVPENVKRHIPEVARACQKKGTAKFDFGEHVIACTALRDQSMCNVEVNILKEGKLIQSKIVNGCL